MQTGDTYWVSHVEDPILAIRAAILDDDARPHFRYSIDDGPAPLLQPFLISSRQEIVPLRVGDIAIQVILIVDARASRCAVAESSAGPWVQGSFVTINLCILERLWQEPVAILVDYGGVVREECEETGVHPEIGIPKDDCEYVSFSGAFGG